MIDKEDNVDNIINGILQHLSQISVSGLDVERMYIAKHQLRQLQTILTAKPEKEVMPNGNDQDNV